MHYEIEGGYPLEGTIRASGNKNAALPCIAAAILTEEPVVLNNIPDIVDVAVMLSILREIGCVVERVATHSYRIEAKTLHTERIPASEAKKIRASILFAGALLARRGRVELPPPGGDVIGRRRLDTHLLALSSLGARVEIDGIFSMTADKLVGRALLLDEASVTATENTIMVAVMAEGETTISNAASEPHVQDLCGMLVSMGAHIEGIGSNLLRIRGTTRLRGTEWGIGPDYMEIGSFIALAAITRGAIKIENVEPTHLQMCKIAFGKLGIHWETAGSHLHVPATQRFEVVRDIGGMTPEISDFPWPGFPPDLTSVITVAATQAKGMILIHEKLFESRLFFVDKLISMGAEIILCDPHRAVVNGPRALTAAVLTSPDVRAGMAMVLAAFCARGKSTIHNIYQIERGYENLVPRLQRLGARIERIASR